MRRRGRREPASVFLPPKTRAAHEGPLARGIRGRWFATSSALPQVLPLPRESDLRRDGSVDVLVEPAGPRARIPGERAARRLRTALEDVRGVVRPFCLSLVGTRDRVAPIGPGPEGRRADGADP